MHIPGVEDRVLAVEDWMLVFSLLCLQNKEEAAGRMGKMRVPALGIVDLSSMPRDQMAHCSVEVSFLRIWDMTPVVRGILFCPVHQHLDHLLSGSPREKRKLELSGVVFATHQKREMIY